MTADNADPIALTANTTYTVEDGTGPFTFSGIISGSYGVTKDGPGTLIFSGLNTFTGAVNVTGGILKANNATSGGSPSAIGVGNNALTVGDGGTLWFAAARSAGYHKGNLTIQSGGTVQIDDSDCSLAASKTTTLYGTAAVTGTGLWRFREAGVKMVVGGQDGTAANATISVSNFEVRDTNFAVNVVNADDLLTISSTIKQDVALRGITKTGLGTLKITGSNQLTGALNLNAGSVQLSGSSALGSMTVNFGENTVLELLTNSRTDIRVGSSTTKNLGTIKVNPNSEFYSKTAQNVYAKLDLSGNGSGSYDTTARGAIRIENNTNFYGDVVLSGDAKLGACAANATTLYTGTFYGNIDTNGHVLSTGAGFQDGGSIVFAGDVSGAGSITIENVNIRTAIGNPTAAETPTTQTIAVPITNNIGTTSATNGLNFNVGANRTVEVAGAITNHGFYKSGAGTVRLTGTGDLDVITVAAGTVDWANSATISGVISGAGTFKVSGADTVVKLTATNTVSNVWVESGSLEFVKDTGKLSNKDANITVGSEAGNTARLIIGPDNALGSNSGVITIYKGGTLENRGLNVSLGNGKGITFIGGGTISASLYNNYFWLRGSGNQALTVMGKDAHALIENSLIYLTGSGKIDIVEEDSDLTFSGRFASITGGAPNLTKIGKGTLILNRTADGNNNIGGTFTIEEGTVILRNAARLGAADVVIGENGKLVIENSTTVALSGMTQGKLVGNGMGSGDLTITDKAIVSPGDGDTLASFAVNGDYTQDNQNSTGYLEIFVKNDVANLPLNSKLNVTGNANMTNATIKLVKTSDAIAVDLLDYFDLVEADSFEENMLGTMSLVSALNMTYDNPIWRMSIVQLESGRYALRATALDPNYVPEPATWVLMLMAVCCMLRVSGRPKDEP